MALDKLPKELRSCINCINRGSCGSDEVIWCGARAMWSESFASFRERAEKRITEMEAHVVQLRKLCADRPNLDHIPNQSVDIEHWFYMIDCAARGGR